MTRPLADQRTCAWCRGPIPLTSRRDAKTCSKPCRQALHRSRVEPAAEASGVEPMWFAYADPPYPGLARKYYSDDERCAEVDHAALIADLHARSPDGWALSTSADAFQDVLALCPRGVRVAIWVKGSRAGESWRARNAYEPVIIWGGRPRKLSVAEDLDDVLIWGGRQHSHPGALVGMKPAPFAEWLFRQLGAQAGDYLDDVFPGSGAVMRAWLAFGGRDPKADPPQQRLGIPDVVTAPPRRLASTPSRLEEASERTTALSWPNTGLHWSSTQSDWLRSALRSVIDQSESLALDAPEDRSVLAERLTIALAGRLP